MIKEKVTIEDLQKFAAGEQKVFTLPNWEKARSAQVLAGQMKNRAATYGWSYKTIISDAVEGSMSRSVTITRIS